MQHKKLNPMWGWVALFITTTGFTGFIGKNGKGGGTAGALVAFVLQALLLYQKCTVWSVIALTVGSFVVGTVVALDGEAFLRQRFGTKRRRHTGETVDHDFNQTNIDEFHGQMLAGIAAFMTWNPTWTVEWHLAILVFSLLLFRMFDITKPGLIKIAEEKFDGTGFGLMFDDTLAGLLALLITGAVCLVLA